MKKAIFLFAVGFTIIGCHQKKNNETSGNNNTKPTDTTYILSQYGLGEIKIGMTQKELESLLKAPVAMKHANDTTERWLDTAMVKYKDIDVSLFFQPNYDEEQGEPKVWELYGLSTSSNKCQTAAGIKVGDDKLAVVRNYDDHYINMGPEFVQVNDSTWLPSKSKYLINVTPPDSDKQLQFYMLDKKINAIGVSFAMEH